MECRLFGRVSRRRVVAGLLGLLGSMGVVQGQASFVFSLSNTGKASFGDLEDQELALYVSGRTRPWMRTATGSYFLGDVTGDGVTDEWNDVDALCVQDAGNSASGELYFSLLANLGPWKDGDVLRLDSSGTTSLVFQEATILQDFGLSDGNCDVDAFHFGSSGTHWMSFAEDEASSMLSSDVPGQISDGDILWWTPSSGQVGILFAESVVNALVSNALGAPQSTSDVLSVSSDPSGAVFFTVQSPSGHDGSVFSDQGGGTLMVDESLLGFSNTVEVNAMSWEPPAEPFLTAGATPRVIPAGSPWQMDLHGDPGQSWWVVVSFAGADASQFPGRGFHGLFLSPADPLVWWSLGTNWLHGTLDGSGQQQVSLPAAPAGFQGLLRAQPVDLTRGEFGTPIAVELN